MRRVDGRAHWQVGSRSTATDEKEARHHQHQGVEQRNGGEHQKGQPSSGELVEEPLRRSGTRHRLMKASARKPTQLRSVCNHGDAERIREGRAKPTGCVPAKSVA